MGKNMEQYMFECINKGEMTLLIQPFVDIETEKVCGGEILTRLTDPKGAVIMPDEFLRVVEKNNIYTEFDFKVFSKCCAWMRECIENGMKDKLITCNFFKQTIAQKEFVGNITGIANGYGIPYKNIGIEILEDEELSDNVQMISNLMALHNMGFCILLDDWGKGYTSYVDLHNIVFDVMKVDRSVTEKIETERGIKIFESIIALAQNLGIKVLCEGIETNTQLSIVKYCKCDIAQGYGLYIPKELAEYEKLLETDGETISD